MSWIWLPLLLVLLYVILLSKPRFVNFHQRLSLRWRLHIHGQSWARRRRRDRRLQSLAFGRSRLLFLRSKLLACHGVYMSDQLMVNWWWLTMLWSRSSRIRCDGKEPCSGVSISSRWLLRRITIWHSESAIIEEKNVYMFKVDEAVLVYQGVRDKTTKRRIMSRSHKNVSGAKLSDVWRTQLTLFRFRWISTYYGQTWSWINTIGSESRQYGQLVWQHIHSSTFTSTNWVGWNSSSSWLSAEIPLRRWHVSLTYI